jgi:alcohol dehydrogenase, propanol-preferring
VDLAADKLELARSLGAEVTIDASGADPAAAVHEAVGGVHAALVVAVATQAFEQAVAMLRPAGTVVFVGLPGGQSDQMRMSIAALVNGELSVRGSNVGTRLDLQEAVDFALNGVVSATTRTARLDEINDVFTEMRHGRITGRVVLQFE